MWFEGEQASRRWAQCGDGIKMKDYAQVLNWSAVEVVPFLSVEQMGEILVLSVMQPTRQVCQFPKGEMETNESDVICLRFCIYSLFPYRCEFRFPPSFPALVVGSYFPMLHRLVLNS